MCIYLFGAKKEIQIEFAAEAVNLIDGGSETVFDILISNKSNSQLKRIHVVYPHPVPLDSFHASPYFEDITGTWLNVDSNYNRFYQTDETHLSVENKVGLAVVTIDSPDPTNVLEQLAYVGIISGTHHLSTYEIAEGEQLTTDQWKILSELGWSVWTIRFDTPVEADSKRWMRFRAASGTNRRNKMPPVERFLKKHGGVLIDHYEITGPIDMRYRITSALKAASKIAETGQDQNHMRLELHGLQQKLLFALTSEETVTNILDWRINIFAPKYKDIDNLTTNGDIGACGPGKNELHDKLGNIATCYQWKAGSRNVPDQSNGGFFQIYMRAHDKPNFTIALPWISFVVGVFSLMASLIGLLLWFLV